MPRRRLQNLACALAVASLAGAGQLAGEPIRLLCFGDSVTEGYGDDAPQFGGGYPERIQRWLGNEGYDVVALNRGLGGETTGEGLSRINSVLDEGGAYLLLMEGTNDITNKVSNETIRHNLDEMAERAAIRGIRTVHATVIPRWPFATKDSDNLITSDLAGAIVSLANAKGRTVADPFGDLIGIPNLFEDYYCQDCGNPDPVGHPNGKGYTVVGGAFKAAMLVELTASAFAILPPAEPLVPGAKHRFAIGDALEFVATEWDFGDGGWAQAVGADLAADHVFLQAGTYVVRVVATRADGTTAFAELQVTVTGTAPAWATRTAALSWIARGPDGADGAVATDLTLQNSSGSDVVASLGFFSEVLLDAAPPIRTILVPAGGSASVADLVPTLFDLASGRGAALVTYYSTSAAATNAALAFLILRAESGGGSSAILFETASGGWSAAARTLDGISVSGDERAIFAVTNVGGGAATIGVDFYDDDGEYADSAVFEVTGSGVRFRDLADLTRSFAARPQPFTALFRAAPSAYLATVLVVDAESGAVESARSLPAD